MSDIQVMGQCHCVTAKGTRCTTNSTKKCDNKKYCWRHQTCQKDAILYELPHARAPQPLARAPHPLARAPQPPARAPQPITREVVLPDGKCVCNKSIKSTEKCANDAKFGPFCGVHKNGTCKIYAGERVSPNPVAIVPHKHPVVSEPKQHQVIKASDHQQPPEFGFMIHYGVYAITGFTPLRKTKSVTTNGSEWYLDRITAPTRPWKVTTVEYHEQIYPEDKDSDSRRARYYGLIEQFENEAQSNWNPNQWMSLIKSTGATYVIVVTKHHDGITLYPSKYGLYHTQRDFIGEICASARRFGLHVGLYYSLMEETPLYSTGSVKIGKLGYVDQIMIPQIKEMVNRYNPDIFWTDGDWHHTASVWKSPQIIAWLCEQNQNIILNDRWGKDYKDVDPSLYYTGKDRSQSSDGHTNWEDVETIGQSWGYAKNQRLTDYKTTEQIRRLRDAILRNGGRFTLNIGPQANGQLDPRELEVMVGLGHKM